MHCHPDGRLQAVKGRDHFTPDPQQRLNRQQAAVALQQAAQDLGLAAGHRNRASLAGLLLGSGNAFHRLGTAAEQIQDLVVEHVEVAAQIGQGRGMFAHDDQATGAGKSRIVLGLSPRLPRRIAMESKENIDSTGRAP